MPDAGMHPTQVPVGLCCNQSSVEWYLTTSLELGDLCVSEKRMFHLHEKFNDIILKHTNIDYSIDSTLAK